MGLLRYKKKFRRPQRKEKYSNYSGICSLCGEERSIRKTKLGDVCARCYKEEKDNYGWEGMDLVDDLNRPIGYKLEKAWGVDKKKLDKLDRRGWEV